MPLPKASLLSRSRWQQTLQSGCGAPPLPALHIHRPAGSSGATGGRPWLCNTMLQGHQAICPCQAAGSHFVMASAPGLNKGSHTYVMDFGSLRQNESLALHNSNWFPGWSTNSQNEENPKCARKFYTQEHTARRNASSRTSILT